MTVSSTKQLFLKSEKAIELRNELQAMVDDPLYNTRTKYSLIESAGTQFIERHMNYMSTHPSMDHSQYVLNLKLMTKIRK